MSKIKIKYFGPIKEGYLENDGWLDLKKVTVFIGNQGSGKSTVAKLISTMSWIEKALNRGDLTPGKFHTAQFLNFLKYQRINNYFDNEKTTIEYQGDLFHISYSNENKFPVVRKLDVQKYFVPKIMYVPAERNFLSSVSDAFNVKGLPATLFTFAEELKKSQISLNEKSIELPINDYKYRYDQKNEASIIFGKDHQINLLEASSGLQSTIPLFLVTHYLALALKDENISSENINVNNIIRMNSEISRVMHDEASNIEVQQARIEEIRNKYINKCFINIVEEPEQNLFPNSQKKILYSLLEFNNMNEGNKLIMTTHSPYLINYLTLAVEANKIKSKADTDELKVKLNDIVPLKSTLCGDDLVVYQLDEKNGKIEKLKEYKGLPSDENYLNEGLANSNEQFSNLLDIEDLCQ